MGLFTWPVRTPIQKDDSLAVWKWHQQVQFAFLYYFERTRDTEELGATIVRATETGEPGATATTRIYD